MCLLIIPKIRLLNTLNKYINQKHKRLYCTVISIEKKVMIRNRYNCLTPSVPRHQRERMTHLKKRHHNQNTTKKGRTVQGVPQSPQKPQSFPDTKPNRKPKGQFLSPKNGQTAIKNKNFTKTYIQRHTMTDIVKKVREKSRECHNHKPQPQQKHSLGKFSKNINRGLNRFYVATTLALTSALVYTKR